MRFSIATVSLGGPLNDKLRAIADAGFEGVEVFETDILAHDGSPAQVGAMIRDFGLDVVAFQPFRDFEGMPEPQRARNFERARRKFELMRELGARFLLVCSNVSPHALGGIDRSADDLRELGVLAAEYDVSVGYEALAWGRHVSDYRDAWEIVRRADHSHVGIILDSWHILARQLPIDPIRAIPADRIAFVQLADAPLLDMDLIRWSRHFRNFPGQGNLPVRSFMDALRATGYDDWLSLEIFNDRFRMALPRHIAEDGERSLIWLQENELKLPPRAHPKRFEWLEFALSEDDAAAIEPAFAAMGFRRAGRHRSKAVTRWTQGAVNLVVNTDPEGLAHAHQIVHGPSVVAMGVMVDDAAGAVERARRLRISAYSQPVGPDELDIPAIRGLGGSLIYFVDEDSELGQVWDVEFTPCPVERTEPMLTRIDHIAQSMRFEETESWRLFYQSLFEFDADPQVDVVDPAGIIESQALQDTDRNLRICLNASQSARTQTSRFLDEYFGAGVQHIAFACPDIFAAVARMRDAGLALLPIHDNYYEDLEARFALAPRLLDQLRAHSVLYDEDESGAYFQAYTEVFADRFFFEIVQRQGYKGFGASNAPIRLAAQAREARPATIPRA